MVYYNFFKPNPHIQWRCWVRIECAVLMYQKCSGAQGLCASYVDTMPTLALRAPSISLARGGTHLVTTGRFLIYSEELFKNFIYSVFPVVLLHHRVIFSSKAKHSVGYAAFEDLCVIQPQTAVVSSHRRMFPLLTKMHEQI